MSRMANTGQVPRRFAKVAVRRDRLTLAGVGRPAFTLIELLVVVAIIALLISILVPALNGARANAKTAVCASNVHQLLLGTRYYADERSGALPWVRGQPQPTYRGAPYDQYKQILMFHKYIPDYKIFRCPGASGENSVKKLFGRGDITPTNPRESWNESYYYMRKSDDDYQATAFREGWWPQFNPWNIDTEEFPELYTEYWFNDYTSCWTKADGGEDCLTDVAGNRVPRLNGGRIDAIPFQNYAVPLSEYGWGLPAKMLRHQGGLNIGFLDGHASRKAKASYYDLDGKAKRPGQAVQDEDPWGNRPFYCWGLTRAGTDWLR
jgi:prepilin-type N-terminal cleavage/methylation domain-containing protein/prepilin-type processing-associated H-X9-DG protein